MPRVRRTARVPYSAAQMFALVNDIEAYPKFLHWCKSARVRGRDGDMLDAEIGISVAGIHKSFATRNKLFEPERIEMQLVSGPFRHLSGQWTFTDLDDGGCEVSLSLDYEVIASPFRLLFSAIFEEIARTQMSGFLKRADELYGK